MKIHEYIFDPDKMNRNIEELRGMIEELKAASYSPASPKLSFMPKTRGYRPKDLLVFLYKAEEYTEKVEELEALKLHHKRKIMDCANKLVMTKNERVYVYLIYEKEFPSSWSRDISSLTKKEVKELKERLYNRIIK